MHPPCTSSSFSANASHRRVTSTPCGCFSSRTDPDTSSRVRVYHEDCAVLHMRPPQRLSSTRIPRTRMGRTDPFASFRSSSRLVYLSFVLCTSSDLPWCSWWNVPRVDGWMDGWKWDLPPWIDHVRIANIRKCDGKRARRLAHEAHGIGAGRKVEVRLRCEWDWKKLEEDLRCDG